MVAPFDVVTTDFGSVVRELNANAGTVFRPFVHTDASERAVFDAMEKRNGAVHRGAIRARYDTRPSPDRTASKESLLAQLRSPEMRPLLDRAERVFAVYRDAAIRN